MNDRFTRQQCEFNFIKRVLIGWEGVVFTCEGSSETFAGLDEFKANGMFYLEKRQGEDKSTGIFMHIIFRKRKKHNVSLKE